MTLTREGESSDYNMGMAALEEIHDTCYRNYLYPLEEIYLRMFRLSEEERQARLSTYEQCMSQHGYQVQLPRDFDKVTAHAVIETAHRTCLTNAGLDTEP
jgi:hypothetical protein